MAGYITRLVVTYGEWQSETCFHGAMGGALGIISTASSNSVDKNSPSGCLGGLVG